MALPTQALVNHLRRQDGDLGVLSGDPTVPLGRHRAANANLSLDKDTHDDVRDGAQ
jgi:hypothetical protein